MSIFKVGDKVTIGTDKDLPQGSDVPYPGRVICTDAHNAQDLTLLVLAQTQTNSTFETLRQFNGEGLCLQAMNRVENESMYLDSNCYPVE